MQFMSISRRRTEAFPPEAFEALMDAEGLRVRQLYAEGTLRALWGRTDIPGAVMEWEAPDQATVQAALDSLPIAQRGMLEVQVIPLRPYRAFCPPE
jgi:muconolactone delta-isomerase